MASNSRPAAAAEVEQRFSRSAQVAAGRVEQQVGPAGVRRQQGRHQEALAILPAASSIMPA
jgi:hypothetical protein